MPIKVRSLSALARACGISVKCMSIHAKKDAFPQPDKKGLYTVAAVKAYLVECRKNDPAHPPADLAAERLAKVAAERALLELELEEKRGSLIDKDTVEMQQRAYVQVVQNAILTMHTTLALLVAGKAVSECEAEIKAYGRRMIASFIKMARKDGGQ